ncbi:MAG: arsenate reductase family protein [Chlorobiaceae bacterium]|nr:arsenate reductase family protein [Chlorobiaceae bacterium]
MTHIIFHEKPGCQNNRRQKEWLELAGHTLDVIDILTHPWTKEELGRFLDGKSVTDCFNPAAPDIRDGLVEPAGMSMEQAIELMIEKPLLIKRPLMTIEGRHIQGFDPVMLKSIISLEPVGGAETVVTEIKKLDLNSCPHTSNDNCTIKEN